MKATETSRVGDNETPDIGLVRVEMLTFVLREPNDCRRVSSFFGRLILFELFISRIPEGRATRCY